MTAVRAVMASLQAAVEAGGGTALALMLLAENLFPPIPSEVVLPLAGYAVHAGRIPFAVALAAATAGSVAGAWLLYATGRFGGRPLLYRYQWLLRLDEAALDRADAWLHRHGPALVFWGRMVPLARTAVSVPAGMSAMPAGRFTALTAAGSAVWNAGLIGAGMLLGARWERATTMALGYARFALPAVAITGCAALLRRGLRARTARRDPPTAAFPAPLDPRPGGRR